MSVQSTASNPTGPVLSQVPPARSFEFDKNAIGNIKSSVNQFRGSVSLPVDFLTLPGRQDLDVKVSAIYSSAVKNQVATWNIGAPTGILGLGWDMPYETIAVVKGGSGTNTADAYYWVSGGSANPLIKTGETTEGYWTFQLRSYEFWSILYSPNDQAWWIVRENGFTYTYGGTGAANAVQWGVKWGNWIGSSSEGSGQEKFAVAWNLASVVSPLGPRIDYAYENVDFNVGPDGRAFTQASYLKTVVDSYGRTLTFLYGDKYGARNPSSLGIVEYQAANASRSEPNAYQNKYETRFLDSVTVADSDGETIYTLQFTYDFINAAASSDPYYGLMWKRCLSSVFQYSPDGTALPAMRFDYGETSDIHPGALKRIVYPSGAAANYQYKRNFIYAPKNVSIPNPLSGSVPGVWHGSDYVVFTYCLPAGGMRVLVYSWTGHWISQDITADQMYNVVADPASIAVFAAGDFISLSLRNTNSNRDELYLYRKDSSVFGFWQLYSNQPFVLNLSNATAGPSSFVAGREFVIAYNKDYSAGAFQGFSYRWQDRTWSSPILLPSISSDTTGVALSAVENCYIAVIYSSKQLAAQFQIFFRDATGAWQSTAPWTRNGLDIASSDGQLLLSCSAQPGYAVATYVKSSTDNSAIPYGLLLYQWDERFYVLNGSAPLVVDLQSPIVDDKSQYDIFRTIAIGSNVNNNVANLRNIGGDTSFGGNQNWLVKNFPTPDKQTSLAFASGTDVALMCVDNQGQQNNSLLTFDPNVPSDQGWSLGTNVTQSGRIPTIAGDYLTVGRTVYFRGTDGTWRDIGISLYNLGAEETVQNRAPGYIAYQDNTGSGAQSYVMQLFNGQGKTPLLLPGGQQKIFVPSAEAAPGTMLAGPRFLVSYPSSSASFKEAVSFQLYNLEELDLGNYAYDYPVANVEIDNPNAPDLPFLQSYFYADSEQSQIAYNALTGISQYPLVYVVPGVKSSDNAPPNVQPEGRSEFYYSNGVSPQNALSYDGWLYNYADVLNGMLLARHDVDSAGKLVASSLNYWQVTTIDANSSGYFYGGYARLVRSTTAQGKVVQESYARFDTQTGMQLWQEQTYTSTDGVAKVLRTIPLYTWQIPAYAQAFLGQHNYSAVAQTTKCVSDDQRIVWNYVSSQATAYKNWAVTGTPRFAPARVYQWTAPGLDAPVFDFSSTVAQAGWLLALDVVDRTNAGDLVTEQYDVNGVPASFIYDREQRYPVAKFTDGSLEGGEVSYSGFEAYEADSGWTFGTGAVLIPNGDYPQIDAHLGTRSVRLAPSTTNGLSRTYQPARQDRPYLFTAWVKKPAGFSPTKGDAQWTITVTGMAPLVVAFPVDTGVWTYIAQAIDLPAGGGASVAISAGNANTDSYVLVDDVKFSPLGSLFEGSGYDTRFWTPNASLGENGQATRTISDQFGRAILATSATDALAKVADSYFSRSGNRDVFLPSDPNMDLLLRSTQRGVLVDFDRGDEWQAVWTPQAGIWQVSAGQLMQAAAGQAGTLTLANPDTTSNSVVAISLAPLEAVGQPAGLRVGSSLCVQWQPSTFEWQLLDGQGKTLAPSASPVLFDVSASPYAGELDAGTVSQGLCAAFNEAGHPLPRDATVAPGSAGAGSWTLTAPGGLYRYDLHLVGQAIQVFRLGQRWIAFLGTSNFNFWVDGQLLFSLPVAKPYGGAPQFFFGSRVAISNLASGQGAQANAIFQDARAIAIQVQDLVDDHAVVSQTIPDDQGRSAVRTKGAFVTAAQNRPLSYCADFANLDWATGKMTGLVSDAYPDDASYPYSRQVYQASPLGNVLEQGLPGLVFSVDPTDGHPTLYNYGEAAASPSVPEASIYFTTVANPNGDTYDQLSNQLGQVLSKASQTGGDEIRNATIFDDAGNPAELRSPNYFKPPADSTPEDWVTTQAFDYAGRVMQITPGKGAATQFVYDRAGNLRFMQDPQGAKDGNFNYSKYDALNRIVESGYIAGTWNTEHLQEVAQTNASWPPTPPTWRKAFTYDSADPLVNGIGRLCEASSNNGDAGLADITQTFSYDVAGNKSRVSLTCATFDSTADNATDYAYDDFGNIVRIVYPPAPDGTRLDLRYQINALNQVTAISETDDFATPLATFAFSADGRPSSETLALDGGTITRKLGYNSPLWPQSLQTQTQSGETLFSETLTYTSDGYGAAGYYDGTIASTQTQNGAEAENAFRYSYSAVGQVENAENDVHADWDLGVVAPVTYDPNGNFASAAQGGKSYSYGYAAGTQCLLNITDIASGAALASCIYNHSGAATTLRSAAFGAVAANDLALTYDPGTKMATEIADTVSGNTLELAYGYRDERIVKAVSKGGSLIATKLYVRGTSALPLMEVESETGLTDADATLYIFGPTGRIAVRRAGITYGIVKDHLGSVRAIVGPNAEIVASYDYLSFGTPASIVEPVTDFNSYLFTGQEFDREVGLYNYNARFYSGVLARFVSQDPARQYFSPYVYAANNPVLYVDPSGLFSIGSFFSALGGLIIGAVEILAGVVVDIVAGVLEVVTGGLSTPASIALASVAGALYGAGISSVGYSVFNFDNFSWKDYGIEMGIGALSGLLTGGFGAIGSAAAEGATGVKAAVEAGIEVSRSAKAASFLIETGISTAGGVATSVVATSLSDVAAGVTPGADLGSAALWSAVGSISGALIPGPSYKAGWGNLGKNVVIGVAKSEAIGVAVNTASNLVNGDPWNQGLINTVFSGVLEGSLDGLQVRDAAQTTTKNTMTAIASMRF